jgi:hypothetical protein
MGYTIAWRCTAVNPPKGPPAVDDHAFYAEFSVTITSSLTLVGARNEEEAAEMLVNLRNQLSLVSMNRYDHGVEQMKDAVMTGFEVTELRDLSPPEDKSDRRDRGGAGEGRPMGPVTGFTPNPGRSI